jgi:predicted nucleic acid-binding protein
MTRRYAIDTNLYVDALRSEKDLAELSAFQFQRTAFIVMSAVVVQELRAGVRTPAAVAALESEVVAPFERRSRLIAPTYWAWKETGRILSALVGPKDWRTVSRSFVNDVLLAMSCREAGVVLVTRNLRDCERIASVRKFAFVPPWP